MNAASEMVRLFHAIFCLSLYGISCSRHRRRFCVPRRRFSWSRVRAKNSATLRLCYLCVKNKKRFASNSPILHLFTAKTDSFPSLHVLHVFCTFYTLLHFVVLKILNKKGSCGLIIRIFSIHIVNDLGHNFAKMFENIFSEKA